MKVQAKSLPLFVLLAVILLPETAFGDTCSNACLNLGLIIDGSSSIVSDSWDEMLDFFVALTQSFTIGASATQMGMVQFGSTAKQEFDFKDPANANNAALADKFASTFQIQGVTSLTDGIQLYLNTTYPTRRLTPPPGCANISDALLIITDGRPNIRMQDLDHAYADLQAAYGKYIYGVAEGDADVTILAKAVGDISRVHYIGSFDDLIDLLSTLVAEICYGTVAPPTPPSSDCDCCRRVLNSGLCCGTTTILPPVTTPTPPPPPTPPCCCQTDVAIIVDHTGSIPVGAAGIVPIRSFINMTFASLNIGPKCVHTAYMGFSNQPYPYWGFSEAQSSSQPTNPGGKLPIPKNNTFTWLALDLARQWFASDTRGTCKKVLLVTDNGSDNKTLTAAASDALWAAGVSLCLVELTGPTNNGPVVDANRNAEAASLTGNKGQWITGAAISYTALPVQSIVDQVVSCLCPSSCCGW